MSVTLKIAFGKKAKCIYQLHYKYESPVSWGQLLVVARLTAGSWPGIAAMWLMRVVSAISLSFDVFLVSNSTGPSFETSLVNI